MKARLNDPRQPITNGLCDVCSFDVAFTVGFISLCDKCINSHVTTNGLSLMIKAAVCTVKRSLRDTSLGIPAPSVLIDRKNKTTPLWDKKEIERFIKDIELVPRKTITNLFDKGYTLHKVSKILNKPFYVIHLSLKSKSINQLHSQAHELLSRRM
jgi:hypothetical protein